MVKKYFFAFVFLFLALINLPAQSNDFNLFEKLYEDETIEKAVATLNESREKGGLDSSGYIFLYYLLKAQGQREDAIYAAIEGFEKCREENVSLIFIDILTTEFGYNDFTEKISYEIMKKGKDKFNNSLSKLAISNLLFVESIRKGDKISADLALDEAGIPKGFFYSILEDEYPRLKFLEYDFNFIKRSEMKYSERDGFLLHIPSSMINFDNDFLALKTLPFESFEEQEFDLIIVSNSPLKIYIDGKLAFCKNSFEKNLPPKDVFSFKANKGNHIIDILYYSANSGDGLAAALYGKGTKEKNWTYLDKIPDLAQNQKIREVVKKDIFSCKENSVAINEAICALYKASLGNLPEARLDFENLLERYPESALLKILYVNLIIEESYDLPQLYAISKGEKIIESLLKDNPECPEAKYYDIILKSSSAQKEEVFSELRTLTEKYKRDPRWFVRLAQELQAMNFTAEAREIFNQAEEIFPGNAIVEEEIYNFYKELGDYDKSLSYLDKIAKRRAVYSEYQKYFSDKGDYGKAIEFLIKEKECFGNFDYYFEKNMVYYLQKMGKYEEAIKIAQMLLDANPKSQQFLILKAKLLCKIGKSDEAWTIFEKIKEMSPKYFDYDYAKWLATAKLPFEKDRISYDEAIKDYDGKADGASSSYVLDHQISLIQNDGSIIERYHGIVKIHDKDGVEREGEVQFPADYLILLRTIKPDGKNIEPEYVSAKRTIGMTGLEAGDIIEYEYFNLSQPNNIKKGSLYTPYVFLFQDIEKPFFHTNWTIKYPKNFKMDFYEQNLPDKPKEYEEDELLVKKYDFNQMPRIAYEPLAPFKNNYLPLADITANISWDDYFNYLKNQFVGSYPVGIEIEQKAQELTEGLKTSDEKIDSILNFIFQEIEGEGERWSDPTETLLAGQGNRLQLALALLKAAGIDYEMLFAESNSLKYDKNPLPTQGRFTVPLIKINSKIPYFLYLEEAHRNEKILPTNLQGARYISLAKNKFTPHILPEDFGPYINCLQKEKRVIDRDGNLKVNLNQQLDPDQSSDLRGILKRVERDRWKEVLQVAFSRLFGNAEIGNYEFKNIDDTKKNLEINAEIYVSQFGTKQDNILKIENLFERAELSKILAKLTKRELPLGISNPIILNQEYEIILPSGKTSPFEKKKKKIESKYGKYNLEIKPKKGEIFIKRFLFIYEQQISKEEYPKFAEFLKQVDECETTNIEITIKN